MLIPTPGQAEQEYLAAYLHEKGIAFTISQDNFHLPQVMEAAANFPFTRIVHDYDLYKEIIRQELESVTGIQD